MIDKTSTIIVHAWHSSAPACSSIYLIGMVFHAGKFELLRFWMNRDLAPNVLFMAPDGGPIEEKETLRDLGVQISTNLTFSA